MSYIPDLQRVDTDILVHLKEEIRLPQHSEYLLQRPYDPFGTMVNFAAAPSWIEKCQRGVADRQLWSTFKDGRVMIDPRNFRGLYLANQIFKQRIDSYRWRYETVLRIKLIQKEESVVYENPEPQWTRITLFVNYVSALDALKLLQHMAPKQYGLRQKPNMLLLEVKDRLAIPYRNNPDDPRIRRQRQEIHETNNFLISHAQDIGEQFPLMNNS